MYTDNYKFIFIFERLEIIPDRGQVAIRMVLR